MKQDINHSADYVDTHELATQMFFTIRDIDNKVNELKNLLSEGYIKKQKINILNGRIRRLLKTRANIVESLSGLQHKISSLFFTKTFSNRKTFHEQLIRKK